jgi:hypothetical protein
MKSAMSSATFFPATPITPSVIVIFLPSPEARNPTLVTCSSSVVPASYRTTTDFLHNSQPAALFGRTYCWRHFRRTPPFRLSDRSSRGTLARTSWIDEINDGGRRQWRAGESGGVSGRASPSSSMAITASREDWMLASSHDRLRPSPTSISSCRNFFPLSFRNQLLSCLL